MAANYRKNPDPGDSMHLTAIILVLLSASPVLAQSLAEESGLNAMLGRTPTDADVMLGIHQFDLFQLAVTDTADMRGDDRLRRFAKAQSAAAQGRDDMLASISRRAGLDLTFPDQPDMPETDRLAGLQGSVGQTYVRDFYQDEVSEYDNAISLLRRYLTKPDNADVKALSEKLLPELQTGLKQAADRP